MSEKILLQAFKSIFLLFLSFICFGPPIISKIGNITINDYFFSSMVLRGPSNIEAESLRESERMQSKIVYVPSIKIINKLMAMDNTKIDLNIPSEESEENNDLKNSNAVRDRKKDLPKRVDKDKLPPPPPAGLRFEGATMQGGSIK
jgi:hypothetical protein